MTVGWFRRLDDDEQDLDERLGGPAEAPAPARPASLMDALHDRISQVAEVTRSELRLQAGVLDELMEHVQRLEARLAAMAEQVGGAGGGDAPSSDLLLHRLEARLEAHASAVETGFSRLMAWLDAPSAVVDLRAAEAPSEAGRA